MPRLVSASEITGWAERLRAAVGVAADRQRTTLGAALRSHGAGWDTEVRLLPPGLWPAAAWATAVTGEVQPVARAVAADVLTTAANRLPAKLTWGMPRPLDGIAQMALRPLLTAAPGFADRSALVAAPRTLSQLQALLDAAPDRYGGITHPEARQTVADAYTSTIDSLNRLVDRVASQMGSAAQSVLAATVDRNQPQPVFNIWCLPGDAKIEARGATSVMRRWHTGTLVRLHGLSGDVLTITAEHPVLTRRGWVRADQIDVGDHLLRRVESERSADGYPHPAGPPAEIEQVFLAAQQTRTTVRMRRGGVQFDGDGIGCEVDVVSVDRELMDRLEPEVSEPVAKDVLASSDADLAAALFADGGADHLLVAAHASGHLQSSSSARFEAAFGISDPSQPMRLTEGARLDASLGQPVVDHGLTDAETFGDAVGGQSVRVQIGDDLGRDVVSSPNGDRSLQRGLPLLLSGWARRVSARCFGLRHQHPGGPESAPNGHRARVQREGDLRWSLARFVTPDEVVDVERDVPFAGHVYDLTTTKHWFLADGFIVHNCSSGDDRVREDHAIADGQEQRPGEPFDVGGEQLLYPGDPAGSDEQTANCRCYLDSTGGAMDDVTGTEDDFSDLDITESTSAA